MAGDAEHLASFYAPLFIVAGPQGSAGFPNDAYFLRWLRGVFAFNRRAGLESMQPVDVREDRLSETHANVTVLGEHASPGPVTSLSSSTSRICSKTSAQDARSSPTSATPTRKQKCAGSTFYHLRMSNRF
jgi:hypothetical protein